MVRLTVDAGSRVTKIYKIGSGVVLAEATCVAYETVNGKTVFKAFGDSARALSGKSSDKTNIVNPVKEGDVDRPDLLARLLVYFFGKIEVKPSKIKTCEVMFVLPCGFTEKLKSKYDEAARLAGIGRVSYTSLPYAAAYGHNIALHESKPVFVLDIGYGVTNIATVSLNGVYSGFTINLGGGNIDVHLIDFVAENFGLNIGALTAERLKDEIGSFLENDDKYMVIEGRDTETGAPASVCISASQIFEVMCIYIDKILEYVEIALNKLAPEVAPDVLHGGIYFSGGMAKCEGLPGYIESRLGLEVHVSEEPALSTVSGAGTILSSERLRAALTLMD